MTEIKETFGGTWYSHPPMRNALLAGFLTGAAFGLAHSGLIPPAFEVAIYAVAIVVGGYHWVREGLEGLFKEREIGIEILMMAATAGSAILGMWDEAAFLVFLYGAAEGLEEYTYAKTRHSIRKLLDLAPKEARLLEGGVQSIVLAEDLKVGDIFLVKPGESIPTDGLIINGRSSVNEAPVTGESLPVEKKAGMNVFAGTMNQEGALEIKATASFKDNTLSKMIHLVEEAQEQKGKAQLFIDKFGRVYTPFVLLGSLMLIAVPALLGAPLAEWARKAVVLLVAAAPCALIMSTPVAIAAGIGRAGRAGVLIKGGGCLESLGKVRAIAFDKTGTLTRGEPVVTEVLAVKGRESDVLKVAYSIERYSEHPLAKAIVKRAEEAGSGRLEVADFRAIAGYGAAATIGASSYLVGKPGLFLGLSPESYPEALVEKLKAEGKTVILVGNKEEILGVLAIRDQVRPQAKAVIEALHEMGLGTAILSGDSQATASAIAKQLQIDDVRADLKPEAKIEAIEELTCKFGSVAMVGDGINDAPALARASVGMAMGTAGSDAAIEAADIALMGDDLTKVVFAVNLGRKARKISLQNIVFSLLLLAVLIPAALAGALSVAAAVFFHEASELIAVANGLRVARVTK